MNKSNTLIKTLLFFNTHNIINLTIHKILSFVIKDLFVTKNICFCLTNQPFLMYNMQYIKLNCLYNNNVPKSDNFVSVKLQDYFTTLAH